MKNKQFLIRSCSLRYLIRMKIYSFFLGCLLFFANCIIGGIICILFSMYTDYGNQGSCRRGIGFSSFKSDSVSGMIRVLKQSNLMPALLE